MPQTNLNFLVSPSPLWWLALLGALFVGCWAYFRLAAPLSPALRQIFRVLRIAALLLLLLILLEPLLTIAGEHVGRPRLALLVDRSSSMRLPARNTTPGDPLAGDEEGPVDRAAEAASILERLEAGLGETFDLSVHGFSGELQARQPDEGVYPWSPLGVTAMGDALEDILVRQAEAPVGGIVLVTDGAHTAGKDPALVARNLSLPVFVAAVGDTVAPPDLLIRQVRAPAIGYVAEPVAVRVVLEQTGLGSAPVRIAIREMQSVGGELRPRGPILAHESLPAGAGGGREREAGLEVRPTRPGLTLFELSATAAEPEIVTLNNRRLFAIDVREKKTRILYLEGEPDWDFSFLKRTLSADTTLAYAYLVRQADDRWFDYGQGGVSSPPRTLAELSPYAAVIIGRLAPSVVGAEFTEALRRFVAEGGGLLFLGAGQGSDLERWREELQGLLPVTIQADRRWGYTLSGAEITLAGLTHEITGLTDAPVDTDDAWGSLPPVWIREGQYSVAPGALTLLSAKVAHPTREIPLLALAHTGGGRVAVFSGRGFWRWDFTMQVASQGAGLAPEFWRRVMRWLSEPSERERFVARPARHVFQDSEPISFTARVLDPSHEPVTGTRVTVSVEPVAALPSYAGAESPDSLVLLQTGQPARIQLYPDGPAGQYAGQLSPPGPGMYRFRAQTRDGSSGASIESDGIFWVEEMGPEFYDLAAGRRLPALLTEASGGLLAESDGLGSLMDALPERYKRTRVVRQAEMWNHWIVFGVVTVLLAAEWILRRRKGLA